MSTELRSLVLRLSERMADVPVAEIVLSRLLVNLGRDLSNMLDERIRPHGLNEVEFRTLASLLARGDEPVYPSDLCLGITQSPANITRITDALVERRLISRAPSESDRRRLVLRITEKGEALLHELMPTMWQSLREIFQGFSADEKEALTQTLSQLHEGVSKRERARETSA